MNNSRFIQITEYCLVEYIYASTINLEPCNLYSLNNKKLGIHQIYNSNADDNTTKNIQDYTAVLYDNNRYLILDEEDDIIDDISAIDRSSIISQNCVYDTIRYHFIGGFDINSYTGLVLSIRHMMNNEKYNIFSSIFLNSLNIPDLLKFNPRPIYLSDRMYDRFVEIKVPSIKKINNSYYNVSNNISAQKQTLGAKLTLSDVTDADSKYIGFIKEYPMVFSIDQCNTTYDLNINDSIYKLYNIDQHTEASLTQVNEYDLFSVKIEEADDGNYFKYNATYDNAFPGEFITGMSKGLDRWVLIHQLNIYENTQYGGSKLTNTLITYQNSGYDQPQLYRPILKHAGIDVSFNIDYMVRLLNEDTGEQIIRTGSVLSYNVNSYGKNTNGIKLDKIQNSHRIFNRVFKSPISQTDLFMEPEINNNLKIKKTDGQNTTSVVERFVNYPLYVDYNKISLSDNILEVDDMINSKIIYRQGDLRLILKPFDQHIKFKVYKDQNGITSPMNLNSVNIYKLVFMVNGDKIKFDSITDDPSSKLSDGELMFKVPEVDIDRILSSSNRDFYITSYNYSSLQDSVMYYGFWFNINEYKQYEDHMNDINDDYNISEKNSDMINGLIESSEHDDIPSDVYIPGYVDENSNNDEISGILNIKPK